MHVDFELKDALGGEGMRDRLSLSCMFRSVSGIEETSFDGDEHIVEITARQISCGTSRNSEDLRLQEAIPVTVDVLNCRLVCHADMIRLNPDELSILLVCRVNAQVSPSLSRL